MECIVWLTGKVISVGLETVPIVCGGFAGVGGARQQVGSKCCRDGHKGVLRRQCEDSKKIMTRITSEP